MIKYILWNPKHCRYFSILSLEPSGRREETKWRKGSPSVIATLAKSVQLPQHAILATLAKSVKLPQHASVLAACKYFSSKSLIFPSDVTVKRSTISTDNGQPTAMRPIQRLNYAFWCKSYRYPPSQRHSSLAAPQGHIRAPTRRPIRSLPHSNIYAFISTMHSQISTSVSPASSKSNGPSLAALDIITTKNLPSSF